MYSTIISAPTPIHKNIYFLKKKKYIYICVYLNICLKRIEVVRLKHMSEAKQGTCIYANYIFNPIFNYQHHKKELGGKKIAIE